MRRLLVALVAAVILVAGLLWALQTVYLTPDAVREEIVRRARVAFSGQVTLEHASASLLHGITLRDLKLASPDGIDVFLQIKEASATPDYRALLSGRVGIAEMWLKGMEISLVKTVEGRFTFERFLTRQQVRLPVLDGKRYLAAAVEGLPAPEPAARGGLAIQRIILQGGRLSYMDRYVPLQVSGIAGSLTLEPGRLVIRELRGRAYDQFGVSVRGALCLPGPVHDLTLKLDESVLKRLLAFIPPVNLMLTFSREQLQGMISLAVTSKLAAPGRPVERSLAASIREFSWSSHTVLAATVQAPLATLSVSVEGREGELPRVLAKAQLTTPLVRPSALTSDISLSGLNVDLEYQKGYARLRGYSGAFREGTISGSGYYDMQGPRPEFELGFSLDGVPLAELGLGASEGSALAPDSKVRIQGRAIPGTIVLSSVELATGASKVVARAHILPQRDAWLLRDASARLDLAAADVARLVGLGPEVALAGRITGTFYPEGAVGSARGRGPIDRCSLSIAAAAATTVTVESGTLEYAQGQVFCQDLKGSALGGRFAGQVSGPGAGARVEIELSGADLAAAARAAGAGGVVRSGRFRATVRTSPAGAAGAAAGAAAAVAATGASAGPAPARWITADVVAEQAVIAAAAAPGTSPALKAALARAGENELRLDRLTARVHPDAGGLAIDAIDGTGPVGRLTGSLRLTRTSAAGEAYHADGKLALVPAASRGEAIIVIVGGGPAASAGP
jgi:hypothetical protein